MAGEYLHEERAGFLRIRARSALFDNDCPHRVRIVARLIQRRTPSPYPNEPALVF